MNSKGGSSGAQKRRDSIIQQEVGKKVFIKNDSYDEGVQDNSQKPFYRCVVTSDNGATCSLALVPEELKECEEPKFRQGFDHPKDLIMDYSDMADKGIEDMIDIDELNHATILWNLYKRYKKDDIYTYVGPTLLAVNPFKNMSHKYPTE